MFQKLKEAELIAQSSGPVSDLKYETKESPYHGDEAWKVKMKLGPGKKSQY
jgi:hypothetical protein